MLKRITFSGIDPSVSPEALKALHAEFPIIEFAFLFTESRKAPPLPDARDAQALREGRPHRLTAAMDSALPSGLYPQKGVCADAAHDSSADCFAG